jgi:hypothetical protein
MATPSTPMTLPGRYYTDAAIFRAELERCYFGRWIHAGRAVAIIACLFACSCTNKVLSSVCMPTVSIDVDSITLMALLDPKLPEGANLSGDFASDRLTVMYRDRRYEVVRRKQSEGACFDFNPPIPLTDRSPTASGARIPWDSRVANYLSTYWPYVSASQWPSWCGVAIEEARVMRITTGPMTSHRCQPSLQALPSCGPVNLRSEFPMAIDISPEIEARLKAKAQAEGVSVATYVERLVSEEDSRRVRLASFEDAMRERLESLNDGEAVDGEGVMARLLAE